MANSSSQPGEAHPAADPGQVVGGAGEAAQHGDIRAAAVRRRRVATLIATFAAVMEQDLADGRAAQRLWSNTANSVDRRPPALLDHRADPFHRDGRHRSPVRGAQRGYVPVIMSGRVDSTADGRSRPAVPVSATNCAGSASGKAGATATVQLQFGEHPELR